MSRQDLGNQHCETRYFETVILQTLTSNIDKLYHCTILYQQKGITIIM